MALRTVLHCTHMTTTTFSVRVRPSTKSRLEKLAKSTGRSRAFLASEAISAYLDTNEWQVAGITRALSSLDRAPDTHAALLRLLRSESEPSNKREARPAARPSTSAVTSQHR
jgi:predicted transcriptional regulator